MSNDVTQEDDCTLAVEMTAEARARRAPGLPSHPSWPDPVQNLPGVCVELFDADTGVRYFLDRPDEVRRLRRLRWKVRGVEFSLADVANAPSYVTLTVVADGVEPVKVSWAPGYSATPNREFHRLPEPIKAAVRAAVAFMQASANAEISRRQTEELRVRRLAEEARQEALDTMAHLLDNDNPKV